MAKDPGEHPFRRYRGDGVPPSDQQPGTRKEEEGRYLADPDLVAAVNTALALGQPLLLEGDPGCGKSALAWSVASELGLGQVLAFHTRSDHQGRDALYRFDHLLRLYDVQRKDARAETPTHYRSFAALGEAIRCARDERRQRVVLIDEVDKAPTDFPNDLLDEMEQMDFEIPETGEAFSAPAERRPVVIITSNRARQLPEAFLRRCVFHYIEFPGQDLLERILEQRVVQAAAALRRQAVRRFLRLRLVDGLHRQPGTAELIGWVRVLLRAQVDLNELGDEVAHAALPSLGALLKSREDVAAVRREGPAPGAGK